MRHVLTDEERLRGVEKSLQSPRLPESLRDGLRRYREQLRAKVEVGTRRRKRSRPVARKGGNNPLVKWLRL